MFCLSRFSCLTDHSLWASCQHSSFLLLDAWTLFLFHRINIKHVQTIKNVPATLHITIPIELCIIYPEMLVFAHTTLAIVSGPLMPCWETTCIDFLCDAHLHPTFLFDRFKCLMLFTNLHFSSIIQRSCMVENECSSCSWVVSIFASHQYCFCVVTICGHCVHTKHKKSKKCCESVLLSRLDTHQHRLCDALLYGYPFSVLLQMTIQLWWG